MHNFTFTDCEESVTDGEYSNGGSFMLMWPTSSPGETILPCPCGENSISSLNASRTCTLAVWGPANSSACELLSTNLCINLMVCLFHHHQACAVCYCAQPTLVIKVHNENLLGCKVFSECLIISVLRACSQEFFSHQKTINFPLFASPPPRPTFPIHISTPPSLPYYTMEK